MSMELPYRTIKELKQAFRSGDQNAGKILITFCDSLKQPKELKTGSWE